MKTSRLSFLAVLASAAVLAVSCTDRSPVSVPPAGTPAVSQSLVGSVLQTTGLLSCRPLPYDSASVAIGPAGGTIAVSGYRLVVPPRALDSTVTITAVAPSGNVDRVEFQPQGLQFAHPAELTMSYANCGIVGGLLPHHIAYVDNDLDILQLLPGLLDLFHRTVTTGIGHFSGYAIAY